MNNILNRLLFFFLLTGLSIVSYGQSESVDALVAKGLNAENLGLSDRAIA